MDRPESLRRCLVALASASVRPASIVVVDQSRGSDRTQAVVSEVVRTLDRSTEVRYLRSTGGMARGQNDGLTLVDQPIAFVTDDDCVPSDDWIEVGTSMMLEHPTVSLLGGRVLPLGPEHPDTVPVATRTSTVALDLDDRSSPWDVGSGNNFVVRTELLRRIGGNDERLGPGARFRGGADMDLFRRLLREGHPGRYEPELVVFHERVSATDRRRRRFPYGFGMGVACALWWRQGDTLAPAILGRYVRMRLRRIARSARRREMGGVIDEALILWGTVVGTIRGAVVADASPRCSSADP